MKEQEGQRTDEEAEVQEGTGTTGTDEQAGTEGAGEATDKPQDEGGGASAE